MLLFKDLDSLQEGFLTKESIKVALRRKGTEVKMESLEEFLISVGIGKEEKIDFKMFKEHLLDVRRSADQV